MKGHHRSSKTGIYVIVECSLHWRAKQVTRWVAHGLVGAHHNRYRPNPQSYFRFVRNDSTIRNFGKRLVKTPKLYFLDTGLMAWLLGIRDPDSLGIHPARGALFETWVVSEWIKRRFNAGQPADLYFWRDSAGLEIDLVHETPAALKAVEIKSGATFASDWPNTPLKWRKLAGNDALPPRIIFGGEGSYTR